MRLGFGELVLYVGTLAVISTAALQMFLASVATMAGQLQPRLLEPREVSRDEVKAATTGKPWSPDSLLWAAQVTDLHISQFRGRPERSKGLSSLCSFLKRRVRPSVALLTGDIVDAKDYKLFGSTQYKEEWEEYSEAMRECSPDFPWLDIRGNHDAFDVQGEEHNSNMFNRYSVQGPRHERSYLEVVEQKLLQQQRTQTSAAGLSLCLVGVDATPSPGLKRLFNFFGILTQEEVNSVTALLDEADHRCNHTVTFGHYPSSSVSAYGDKDLRHLLSKRVYLCGHYHTGYGYFPHMYTRHPTGMLELELGDWKDYRMYRLFAFDNGVFSFSDFDFSSPTPHIAAVVTSPRPARFAADSSSSSGIDSSIGPTIRALVFADESIESVSVLLPSSLKEEGSPIVLDMEKSSNVTPLYEAAWPSGYLDSRRSGLHRLTVLVALKSGHTSEFHNDYSLDGSQRPYEFWADVILLSDWLPVSALAFAFATFAVVGSIAAARILRHALVTGIEVGEEEEDLLAKKKDKVSSNGVAVKSSSKCKSGTYPFLFRAPLRNFCLISCCDRIARPIILASLYACFLPWCFGRVLGDRLALVSAWGVLLLDDLTLLSPDMAFIVGILWHATTTFPLLAVLSNAAGRALKRERSKRTDPPPPKLSLLTPLRFLWRHLGIAVILGMLAHNCFVLWWMYGAVSVLSPWGVGRLWLAACTYRRANGMRRRDFQAIGIRV